MTSEQIPKLHTGHTDGDGCVSFGANYEDSAADGDKKKQICDGCGIKTEPHNDFQVGDPARTDVSASCQPGLVGHRLQAQPYPVQLMTNVCKHAVDGELGDVETSSPEGIASLNKPKNDANKKHDLSKIDNKVHSVGGECSATEIELKKSSGSIGQDDKGLQVDSKKADDVKKKSRRKNTPQRINKNNRNICGEFVATAKKDLTNHQRNCGVKDRYKCFVCQEEYEEEGKYQDHMKMYNTEESLSCSKCDKLFHSKGSLNSHMRIHSEPKQTVFKCGLCDVECESKNSFQNHVKTHGVAKPFKCLDCGKEYALYDSLLRHSRVHDISKAFKCEDCGKHFAEHVALKRHRTIHTGEKPYKCSRCGQGFRDPSTLKKHEKRHGTDRPFICENCGKTFASNYDLRKHLKIHIEQAEREFQCGECGKGFYLRAALTTHIRTHTKEKPFKCEVCNKSYADQSNLYAHAKTHRNEDSLQCDLCGLMFKWRCNLVRHLRIVHFKEKLFKCPVPGCGKEFGQQTTLIYHTRIHNGEKPFACDKCGKRFTDRTSLNRHDVTHTKATPFECELCGRCYRGKFLLRRHMNRHIKKMFDASANKHRTKQKGELSNENLPKHYKVIVEKSDNGTFLTRIVKKDDNYYGDDSNFAEEIDLEDNVSFEVMGEEGEESNDPGSDEEDDETLNEETTEELVGDTVAEKHDNSVNENYVYKMEDKILVSEIGDDCINKDLILEEKN